MSKLQYEIHELKRFIDLLERTTRDKAIDEYKKTSKCIHVLENFSAIATQNHKETTQHLRKVNVDYEDFREHALNCKRCQISLDSILLFKGYENQHLFPKKIQKILNQEWSYDGKKGIYIGKLPAPFSGNWSNKARLVYFTSLPVQKGVEEFIERNQKPLNLRLIWDNEIVRKRTKNDKGIGYFQANAHHKCDNWHTYLSIRSRVKD